MIKSALITGINYIYM